MNNLNTTTLNNVPKIMMFCTCRVASFLYNNNNKFYVYHFLFPTTWDLIFYVLITSGTIISFEYVSCKINFNPFFIDNPNKIFVSFDPRDHLI